MIAWLKRVAKDAKHLQSVEAPRQSVTRVNMTGFTAKQLAILRQLADSDDDGLLAEFVQAAEYTNGEAADEAQ